MIGSFRRGNSLVWGAGFCLALVIGLVVAPSLVGCAQKRHQDRFRWHEIIASIIESKRTSGGPEYLDVRRVMPFGWERFYVFPPHSTVEEIERALGFNWGRARQTRIHERDDITLLVFITGRTVHEYIEHPRAAGDFSRLRKGYPYTANEAYFELVADPQGERDPNGRTWLYFREAERPR